MPAREIRAVMRQLPDGWTGRLGGLDEEVHARTREDCLGDLRRLAGEDVVLTVEMTPAIVGVSEAAAILGWDRRRVITYVDRGSFPPPIARLASGRVWRRDDVEVFARAIARRRARRGSGSHP